VTIQGGPPEPVVKTLPKHKKNPDVGEKKTVYTSNILIDQDDALSFEDNEEVRYSFHKRSAHTDKRKPDHSHGLGQRHRALQGN
jgi:hypothetical protein